MILQVCSGRVDGVGRGHSNDEGVQSPTEPRVEKPSGHPQVCKPQDKHLQTLPTARPTQLCQLARWLFSMLCLQEQNYLTFYFSGGAIFGATDVVVTRSLGREQYLRDPAVPDWANLRYE